LSKLPQRIRKNKWAVIPHHHSNVDVAAGIMSYVSLVRNDTSYELDYNLLSVTGGEVGPGSKDLFPDAFFPIELKPSQCSPFFRPGERRTGRR